MIDTPQGVAASHAIRVLLIDDQRMVGEAVRRMLLDEPGLVFEYCQKPEDAVATAERFGPTVILQDLVMPAIDGLTLVDRYRANPQLREVPTIVLSSQEEPLVKPPIPKQTIMSLISTKSKRSSNSKTKRRL